MWVNGLGSNGSKTRHAVTFWGVRGYAGAGSATTVTSVMVHNNNNGVRRLGNQLKVQAIGVIKTWAIIV